MALLVDYDREMVSTRVKDLTKLLDQMVAINPRLQEIRARQTAAVWTNIPSCVEFSRVYAGAIDTINRDVQKDWSRIEALAVGLQQSAAALTNIDEATEQALAALVRRLDAARPPSFAPEDGAPPVQTANVRVL